MRSRRGFQTTDQYRIRLCFLQLQQNRGRGEGNGEEGETANGDKTFAQEPLIIRQPYIVERANIPAPQADIEVKNDGPNFKDQQQNHGSNT